MKDMDTVVEQLVAATLAKKQARKINPPSAPRAPRRVGSYCDAIKWVAANDDNDWLTDPNGSPSVALCLVADVFGRTTEEATRDLVNFIDGWRPRRRRAS